MKKGAKWLWFLPACGISIGIFFLSTFLSAPIQIDDISYLDKWAHGVAYFVLCLSFLWASWKANSYGLAVGRVIVLLVITYGVSLEFVQFQFFPDRFFDWMDAAANAFGAGLAYLLFKRMQANGKKP